MRLLLSFLLLVLVLGSVAVGGYYFRRRLMVIFGLVREPLPQAQKTAEEEHTREDGCDAVPGGVLLNSGVGTRSTSFRSGNPSAGTESGSLAPMMIVLDGAGRGGTTALPYDTVKAGCGHWASDRRLGSGGAADVYRAELSQFGPVAVKRFHPSRQGASREWTRELDALCECRHPHILEVIGHSDEGPENLIIMPLMEGGTFGKALSRLWWAARSILLGQVVRAVTFLHGKSILHRDIKSTNILLDRSLRHARLADFGLAKDQDRRAQQTCHGTTGIVVGSPGYMAPELMMRPATPKTDAFALGVVFLEVLTGLPAWDAISEGGSVLTDKAVAGGAIVTSLLDRAAEWTREEVAVLEPQAVGLTLFDPSKRITVIAVEQDASFGAHLKRADLADCERRKVSPSADVVGHATS